MDHNNTHPVAGAISVATSLCTAFLAVFNLEAISTGVRLVAGLVAVLSGAMAIRYYYYATKSVKSKKTVRRV